MGLGHRVRREHPVTRCGLVDAGTALAALVALWASGLVLGIALLVLAWRR